MLKCLISDFQLLYLHPANSPYFNLNKLLTVKQIFKLQYVEEQTMFCGHRDT